MHAAPPYPVDRIPTDDGVVRTIPAWRDLSAWWREQAAALHGERKVSALSLSHAYELQAIGLAHEVLRDASVEQAGPAAPRLMVTTRIGTLTAVCRTSELSGVPGGPRSPLSYAVLDPGDGARPWTVLLREVLDVHLLDQDAA